MFILSLMALVRAVASEPESTADYCPYDRVVDKEATVIRVNRPRHGPEEGPWDMTSAMNVARGLNRPNLNMRESEILDLLDGLHQYDMLNERASNEPSIGLPAVMSVLAHTRSRETRDRLLPVLDRMAREQGTDVLAESILSMIPTRAERLEGKEFGYTEHSMIRDGLRALERVTDASNKRLVDDTAIEVLRRLHSSDSFTVNERLVHEAFAVTRPERVTDLIAALAEASCSNCPPKDGVEPLYDQLPVPAQRLKDYLLEKLRDARDLPPSTQAPSASTISVVENFLTQIYRSHAEADRRLRGLPVRSTTSLEIALDFARARRIYFEYLGNVGVRWVFDVKQTDGTYQRMDAVDHFRARENQLRRRLRFPGSPFDAPEPVLPSPPPARPSWLPSWWPF